MKSKKLHMRQEDYLESIYLLSQERGAIRITDIAESVGVRKSTVVSMIEKLVQEGYLEHEKYGDVHMTARGIELARQVYRRHVTIKSFFKEVLGLSEEVAELDACRTEHHMSEETIARLQQFMEYYQYKAHHGHSMADELRDYIEMGRYPCDDVECAHIKPLSDLVVGDGGVVLSVRGEKRVVDSLFSKGLLPGVGIELTGVEKGAVIVRVAAGEAVVKITSDVAGSIDIEHADSTGT
jgi:DtxR family Mn-dependent transcriptional regulator